jgi:predicted RNA-binding Zn-ribbon protein involved in translation (DUF1610 family)
MPDLFELHCSACLAATSCGPKEMAARLRQVGKLRRAAEPEAVVLAELFVAAAPGFRCDACGHVGLSPKPAAGDNDDWEGQRACESCGRLIPAERVELFPNVKVCVACQSKNESGQDQAEPEYCPRCGAIMKLRQSRARGITRYVTTCPECGR